MCPICHLGHLNAVQTVLVRFYGDTLVHLPNTPAQKCDVCGETFFEDEMLRRLDLLVGESGPPPNRHPSAPHPSSPADTDADLPLSPAPLRSRSK